MPFIGPDPEVEAAPQGFVGPDPEVQPEEASTASIMDRIRRGEEVAPADLKRAYDADGVNWAAIPEGVKQLGIQLVDLAGKAREHELEAWRQSSGPVDFAIHQIPRMGRSVGEGFLQGTAGMGQLIRRPLRALYDTVKANAIDPTDQNLKIEAWRRRVQDAAEENRVLDPYFTGEKSFLPGTNPGVASLVGQVADPTMLIPGVNAAGVAGKAGRAARLAEIATEAAAKGGALRTVAGKVAPAVEHGAELTGKAAGAAATLVDKVQPALDVAGLLTGGVKGIGATHAAGRGASLVLRWASKVRDTGTALRNIAKADWKSSQPIYAQLAKDIDAPVWLRRASSTAVAPLVESTLRGAGTVAKGAAEGAAVAGVALLDDTLTPDEKGVALGQGIAFGSAGAGAGRVLGTGNRAQMRQAHDIAVRMQKAIEAGTDPAAVLGASDAVMFYADNIAKLFQGAMPGGKDLNVVLADAAQFQAMGQPEGAVAFFETGADGKPRVVVNISVPQADGRLLHEAVGHALAESVVSSNPAILAQVRAAVDAASGGAPETFLQAASEQYAKALMPDSSSEVQAAYLNEQRAKSAQNHGDPDAWILTELWSESAVRAVGGQSLLDIATPSFAGRVERFLRGGETRKFSTSTSTFFQPEISRVLDDPNLQQAILGSMFELGQYRPGIDAPAGRGIKVLPQEVGKVPHATLHDLGNGQSGNDFVVQTPDGRVVARPAGEVRKLSRNRRQYVDKAVPRDGPVAPVTDTDPMVKLRQTIGGMVERSGAKLGQWFYSSNMFSETTKNIARAIEAAIESGETLSGWYHQIGESMPDWARSVEKDYGNLEAQFKDFVPIGFKISKPGNLLTTVYSLSSFAKKAAQWSSRRGPVSLELWNGDVGAFTQDVQTYLKNHREGRPGADGIGEQKRDLINAFLVGGNRTFEARNPLRASLRGQDAQGIVRSYRLDRLEPVKPSEVQGFQKPSYERQVRNLSPKTEDPSAPKAEVVRDDQSRNGLDEHLMKWGDGAVLSFTLAGDTAYVTGIKSSGHVRGSAMLSEFREGPAKGRRVSVVGAAPDVFQFWEKAKERGLIDSWTDEDVDSFFDLDETGDEAAYSPAVRLPGVESPSTRFSPMVPEEAPKKTVRAYKLFRTLKSRPGELFPLFIGKNQPVPVGQWVKAEHLPTKGFAERPGWHAGVYPEAPHLMKKDGTLPPDRVWAEVELPADVDWQAAADATRTGDIRDKVPEGGHYKFATSKLQGGGWIIGGALKVNKVLSAPEVARINSERRPPDTRHSPAAGDPGAVEKDGFYSKLLRTIVEGPAEYAPKVTPAVKGRTIPGRTIRKPDGTVIKEIPERREADKPETVISAKDQLVRDLKAAGVKDEEIKWSGILDFVEGKERFDRGELVTHARQKLPRMTEKSLGGENTEVWSNEITDQLDPGESGSVEAPDGSPADAVWDVGDGKERFTVYKTNKQFHVFDESGAYRESFYFFDDVEAWVKDRASGQSKTQYHDYTLPGGDKYREVIVELPNEQNGYTSDHFSDSANYLAHMRVDERPDSTGKAGLFIQEIQSDRHQEARKKGYVSPPPPGETRAEITKKMRELESEVDRLLEHGRKEITDKFRGEAERFYAERGISNEDLIFEKSRDLASDSVEWSNNEDRIKKVWAERERLRTKLESLEFPDGVPDAPFRKDWGLHMFKRALRDAVESGKRWIGWTDGDTQVARYDLAKHIDALEYAKDANGNYTLAAEKNAREVFKHDGITPDKLEDYVGKDLARKILADEGERAPGEPKNYGVLSGLDLRVGGEGMRGFYDELLPAEVGRYVKRYGAKVEKGFLPVSPPDAGGRLRYTVLDPDGNPYDAFPTQEQAVQAAQDAGRGYHVTSQGGTQFWRVRITPSMEAAVRREGQERYSPAVPDDGARHSLRFMSEPPVSGRRTITEIGRELSRANAARGRMDLAKEEHRREVAAAMAAEAKHALQKPDSGVDWYADSIRRAMDTMTELHPEFRHDSDAAHLFKALVAITSNGSDVRTNLKNGHELYSVWKSGFEIPTTRQLGGKASQSINEGLGRLNEMLKAKGLAATIAFLNSEFTVGELKRLGFEIPGESVKEKVRGSMIFGPKIGAFYTNLRGDFSPVTMDRWFMRTVGRLTGTLSDISVGAIPNQVERLLGALRGRRTESGFNVAEIRKQAILLSRESKSGELTPEEAQDSPRFAQLRDFVSRMHSDFAKRGFKDGSEIEKAAKVLDINLTQLQEAPENGSHRSNIRKTVAEVQSLLRADGIEISNAALQAALWYYEKELVTRRGYRSSKGSEAVDYSMATRELVDRIRGGSETGRGAGSVRPEAGVPDTGAAPPPDGGGVPTDGQGETP